MQVQRILRKIQRIASISILTLGAISLHLCRYTEELRYEHEPSVEFYKHLNFSADYLSPYKVGDILFVVRLSRANRDSYRAWVRFYARSKGKSVFMHKARISGNNWQMENCIEQGFVLNTEVEYANLVAGSAEVFHEVNKNLLLDNLLLEDLSNKKYITLDVSYSINDIPGTMIFKIFFHVENRTIYPT